MFTESERRVYGPYLDGSGGAAVFGDPLKISRLLTQLLDGNPNEAVTQLKSDDPAMRAAAIERAVIASVQAFELAPFNKKTGAGLMEDEIMKVFEDFCRWMGKKKENGGPTQIGSNVSDGHPLGQDYKNEILTAPAMPETTPGPTPAEQRFLDEKARDHERIMAHMAPIQSTSRVGLPSTST